MADFELIELPEQATVVRRAQLPTSELSTFFRSVYGDVWEALTRQGLRVVGEPFAAYHGMPSDTVDVEAGVAVEGTFTGDGDVQASVLPAVRAAVATHVGPYEGLGETWTALQEWAVAHGHKQARDMFWETYLTDPREEPDPAAWRTRLVLPVT